MKNEEYGMKNEEQETQDGASIEQAAANDLLVRAKQFALRVIRVCHALPKTSQAVVIGGSCYGVAPRLVLTTERPIELDLEPISFRKWDHVGGG